MRFSRRDAIAMAAIGWSRAAWSRAPGLATIAAMVDAALVERVLAALFDHRARLRSVDVVAIADFGRPSSEPRLFLADIVRGMTIAMRVAHGKGSDPTHSGALQSFSNMVGSGATAAGAYLTGDLYHGRHGLSRRLVGLDRTNDRAEERAIVIHSAWYANTDVAERQGKLGRSDGCFAVGEQDIAALLGRLGPGRLLYAGRSPAE